MIRYSKSFFISLFIHTSLLLLLLFTWQNYSVLNQVQDKKICLKLCSVELKKETPKNTQTIIEPEIKKIQEPKPIQKPKKAEIKKEPIKAVEEKQEVIKEVFKEATPPMQQSKDVVVNEKTFQKNLQELPKKEPLHEQKKLSDEYIKVNTQKISQLLQENLYYPLSARKRNITGQVKVKFTLKTNAQAINIKVVESSSDILSRSAIKTIEDLSEKFPKPKEEIELIVNIDYNLN